MVKQVSLNRLPLAKSTCLITAVRFHSSSGDSLGLDFTKKLRLGEVKKIMQPNNTLVVFDRNYYQPTAICPYQYPALISSYPLYLS